MANRSDASLAEAVELCAATDTAHRQFASHSVERLGHHRGRRTVGLCGHHRLAGDLSDGSRNNIQVLQVANRLVGD